MNSPQRTTSVLSIAGVDPSGGAGLLADIKIFEAAGLQGLGVVSAVTAQNDREFSQVYWQSWAQIEDQLNVLARRFQPRWIKIGLIQNAETLSSLLSWIRKHWPQSFVLWDPILQASAGYDFHSNQQPQNWQKLLPLCDLVTPNIQEWDWLSQNLDPQTAHSFLLLKKGGHQKQDPMSTDLLYFQDQEILRCSLPRLEHRTKHGTGCMLSAAIIAALARGARLEVACTLARHFLQSVVADGHDLLARIAPHWQQISARQEKWQAPNVYPITFDGSPHSHAKQVQALIQGGAQWIQLRMKNVPEEERQQTARHCLKLCRRFGVRLFINDDAILAREIQADGVHVGWQDMPVAEVRQILGAEAWIGGTANTPEQVRQRLEQGVDLIGLGPWKHTETKKNLSPVLGVEGVIRGTEAAQGNIPVYVIGGVQPEDFRLIFACGAQGVALSSILVCQNSVLDVENRLRMVLTTAQTEKELL